MTRDLEAYPKITEDPHYSTMATLPDLKRLKTLRDLSADAPNEELIEEMPIAGGSVKLTYLDPFSQLLLIENIGKSKNTKLTSNSANMPDSLLSSTCLQFEQETK